MKKLVYKIIFFIATIVFLFSVFKISEYVYLLYQQDKLKDNLQEYVHVSNDGPPKVDWEALMQLNSDVVAWIHIPDTSISYPIVQGSDNEYYLNHDVAKQELYSGSIFLDAFANHKFEDSHSIIYGHNVKYGTMFADLEKFKDKTFYEAHPYIYITTPTQTFRGEVFSIYTTVDTSSSYETEFSNESIFLDFLQGIQEQSDFASAMEFNMEDKVVTLSTCSYERDGQPSELRYVVHAKLVAYDE